MNEIDLLQAISLLESFEMPDNVYKVSDSYVTEYHKIVADIENNLNCNLDRFKVPYEDIENETRLRTKRNDSPFADVMLPEYESVVTGKRFCDPTKLVNKRNGLLGFLRKIQPAVQEKAATKIRGFANS